MKYSKEAKLKLILSAIMRIEKTVKHMQDNIDDLRLIIDHELEFVMKYNVWVKYPMPARFDLDVAFTKIPGWCRSGYYKKERDHSFILTENEVHDVLVIMPSDAKITIYKGYY